MSTSEMGRKQGRRFAALVPDELLSDAGAFKKRAECNEYVTAVRGHLPEVGKMLNSVAGARLYFDGLTAGIAEVRTERLAELREKAEKTENPIRKGAKK